MANSTSTSNVVSPLGFLLNPGRGQSGRKQLAYAPLALGLLTALCWGTADFVSRRQSSAVGPYKTALYVQGINLAMLLVLFPFLRPPVSVGENQAVVLIAAGVLNFFSFVLLYRSLQAGPVSLVAPIAYTYPAVTSVLSVAILGVSLGLVRGLAISGVVVGVVLLSTKFSELGRTPKLASGIAPAVACSVSFGTIYLGMGYAAPTVGYFIPAVVLRAAGVGAGLLCAPLFGEGLKVAKGEVSKVVLAMGVLETVGLLTFTYGISEGGVSIPIVAALSGMGGAFASGYAVLLLKERLEWNQVFGVVLSLMGVFFLLLLGA